jgi:acetylornithine deacetylase/succinyl-diaminopimelate desuccinylase-like protein
VPDLADPTTDAELERETTDLLARLIRFNTVNPPGAERAAQEFLANYLRQAGFECELLALDEDRPNLIARLPGAADGPTLCYLGHVDTVLATPDEWSHDPWSGDVDDGFVWGRGALDMKSQVAAEAVAAASLARRGWRPAAGELRVVFVVDEEAGGAHGAQFLTEQHPDKVRCDYVLNEGGGEVFEYAGRRLYGLCCAEKGVFRFTITTDGAAGHASIPKMGDNALLKMAPLLERLAAGQPSFDITAEPRALLAALSGGDDVEAALAQVQQADPRLAALLEPMLGVTLVPTRIRASEKVNVIPSHAHLQVDCRVPPGLGEAEARTRIEEVLGRDGYRLEFSERVVGNRSALETPLMEEIRDWTSAQDPGAEVVPTVLPGFTDSRWFREAFPDCVAYGFFPQSHMTLLETSPLVHGADERIDVRDLGFAARFYSDLPERVLR